MNNEVILTPLIPNTITVHLGEPDEAAKNITVPFIEYIKNVASSELYPTWPEEALKANILAQISFTLNRLYNEWYRSKGYDFEITSSPKYDQNFIENRTIFENISKHVDELFNSYIRKQNTIDPYFTEYCDGKQSTCDGLSQWGTIELSKQGKKYLDILKYYYGNDIELVEDAPTSEAIISYPDKELKLGDANDNIRIIKRQLNRIAVNYPGIPTLPKINQFFDTDLENSIKKFQEIFNLDITGTLNKSTWYKIKYLFTSVKKLEDLYGEGIKAEDVTVEFENSLGIGEKGDQVRLIHYFISTIAYFDEDIPLLELTNEYNKNTKEIIIAIQNKYGLETTGRVDIKTWNKIRNIYKDIIETLPKKYLIYIDEFFPGRFLSKGMTGEDILSLQKFLLIICQKEKSIPGIRVNGNFDDLMEKSIMTLEKRYNHEVNGVVGPILWYEIVELSKSLT